MFRRRDKSGPTRPEAAGEGETVYEGLRRQVLDLDPGSARLAPEPGRARVWGLRLIDEARGNGNGGGRLARLRGRSGSRSRRR